MVQPFLEGSLEMCIKIFHSQLFNLEKSLYKHTRATQTVGSRVQHWGVPWRYSELRMQRCHCCDSGYYCGMGSILVQGTSPCQEVRQKKKKNRMQTLESECYSSNPDPALISHRTLGEIALVASAVKQV